MSETFNSSDGRTVVAADSAETVGEIKGFVIDPSATRIDSVHVAGRGRRAEVVPWASIQSFGADAVIIELADAVERVSSDHESQAVKGKVVARDTRVLDTNGFERGKVEDVMFDTDTGLLTGALSTEGHLDGSRFRAIGSYALIINAE